MLNFKLFRIYFGHPVGLPNIDQTMYFYGIEFGRRFVGFIFTGKGV